MWKRFTIPADFRGILAPGSECPKECSEPGAQSHSSEHPLGHFPAPASGIPVDQGSL